MNFDKLKELEVEAVACPNYILGKLPDNDFMKLASKAFARLTPDDAKLVINSWHKFCDKSKIPFNMEEAIRARFLAQTNLFFLCKLVEKYKDITIKTHEEICNSFFVAKDPANFDSFENFAKSYNDLKDRLLLVPRGGFKSSIDIADCVQWTICFPEITILILTGVYNLAKDFVGELRQHFLLQEIDKDAKDKPIYGPKTMPDGSESLFQILFPEHCIRDVGKETEFQTPASKLRDKEPTVMAASIEQSLSGWHFCVMKLDDVVTNENSQTVGRMESVAKQVSVNRAMLHPFGFLDKIGTWYDEIDIYGLDIKYEEKLKADGEAPTMKIYLKSAWQPTEAALKAGKIEEEMVEADWKLWFPERLPYKYLIREKKKDPEGFAIKYENDPRKVHQVKFPRELLIRRTIPAMQLPPTGMVVTVWDTAYSTKNFADYTVGITALIYGGKFYVIDMVRGRFNEYELPNIIAATGNKWKPKRIAIEDSMGVRWLSREIRREMDRFGISIPIEFISLGLGSKTKSKEMKAKPVLRLLGDSRLFLSAMCAALEDLYTELEKFPKGSHDDIVSALSILVDQFAAYADMEARMSSVSVDFTSDGRSKAIHDRIYGLGSFSQYNANNDFATGANPVMPKGTQSTESLDYDPLSGLFD